jgi:hypothetical protein
VTTLIVGIGEVFGGGIRGFGPIPAVTGNCAAPPQAETRIGATAARRRISFAFCFMLTSPAIQPGSGEARIKQPRRIRSRSQAKSRRDSVKGFEL